MRSMVSVYVWYALSMIGVGRKGDCRIKKTCDSNRAGVREACFAKSQVRACSDASNSMLFQWINTLFILRLSF